MKTRQHKEPSVVQQRALAHIKDHPTTLVVGVDECGTGSWAGPVVVAAAAAYKDWDSPNVTDSKRLTHAKRLRAILEDIYPGVLAFIVLEESSEVIDREGIENVRRRLTVAAANACLEKVGPALVVQDGEYAIAMGSTPVITLPSADLFVPAVSAASILGKVYRDLRMHDWSLVYPEYEFDKNVGYHSDAHVSALARYGVTPLHRRSYRPIRAYLR